ncbi:aldehyde dehydrogenase family protein [Nocardioides sp. KR10-350]|uniref:aldehyde dehydrogenase family protein n=1 Tax=Nocardioides cheoyonin TaxID=3156615 RepID=UPI0032B60236
MASYAAREVAELLDGSRAATVLDGGRWSDGVWWPVHSPADTRMVIGEHAVSSPDAVEAAVGAAVRAFPAWRDLGAAGRASLLSVAAAELARLAPLAARVIGMEVGKVEAECAVDAGGAARLLEGFAAQAEAAMAPVDLTADPATRPADAAVLHRAPVGPVAVIAPWNTPAYLTVNMAAPALAAGCPVVVKPPEAAPLAVTALLERLAAMLPPGVVNVVQGPGAPVGEQLVSHAAVRAVLFTGGVVAGRRVLTLASETVKKVHLELGGNDPAVVLDSAVVDDTLLRELIAGSFSSTGQICYNVKRIYVHRSMYDELVDGLSQMLSDLVVGHPFDPQAHIGPLTTEAGHARTRRLLAELDACGAKVQRCGRRASSAAWEHGYFVDPHLVTGVPPDAPLVLEEQFAPVLPVLPFDEDDEAVARANRTEYGLGSSVWSRDVAHAEAVARRIEAGNTFVNVHRIGASVGSVPFGGWKQSGLGRNHGAYSFAACTEEHAVIRFDDAARSLPGLDRWSALSRKEPGRV